MRVRSAGLRVLAVLALVVASVAGGQSAAGAAVEWPTLPAEWVRIDHNQDTLRYNDRRNLPQGGPAVGFVKYRVICKGQNGSANFDWRRTPSPTGGVTWAVESTVWQSPIWSGYRTTDDFRFSFSLGGGVGTGMDCYLWGSRQP